MERQEPRFYEFGPFRLDPVKRRLWRDGDTVTIQPKAFDTLLVLLKNRERVLDADELMELLWPDTAVEEQNLKVNISHLRKALGDDPHEHGYIVTMPGRGYRFVAAVRELPDEGPALAEEPVSSTVITLEGEEAEQGRASLSETAPMISPVPASPAPRRSLAGRLWLLSLLLIGLVAGIFLVFSLAGRTKPQPTGVAVKSLAVLPFKQLGGPARDESLELGMADVLITRLSNLRQLIVRPTSAILRYVEAKRDPLAAGRELTVDAVLDGSVQREGDRVQLTIQLIRVRDGVPLWGDTFVQEWTYLFEVQSAIAEKVAEALTLTLSGEEKERLSRRDTTSGEAYGQYLKGRLCWNKRSEEWLKKGLQYFERATNLDPNYALAYSGLADSYNLLGSFDSGGLPPREAFPKARRAAERALEIDEGLAEAHASLGYTRLFYEWDWSGAETEFQRAVRLNSNYANTHMWYALYFAALGRFDEALAQINRAEELDPTSLVIIQGVGRHLYLARQYDRAIAQIRQSLELDPGFSRARLRLGEVYVQKRMFPEAIAELREALALSGGSPNVMGALGHAYAVSGQRDEAMKVLGDLRALSERRYVSPFALALVYTGLGDKDQAFAWLRKSVEERSGLLFLAGVLPPLDSLRSDQRFGDLLRQIGLPQQTSRRASR